MKEVFLLTATWLVYKGDEDDVGLAEMRPAPHGQISNTAQE